LKDSTSQADSADLSFFSFRGNTFISRDRVRGGAKTESPSDFFLHSILSVIAKMSPWQEYEQPIGCASHLSTGTGFVVSNLQGREATETDFTDF